MRYKQVMASVMCGALLAVALTGCGGTSDDQGSSEVSGSSEVVVTDVESEDPTASMVTVSTEYGELYYSDEWEEFMVVDQSMEGDVLTVSFSAEINETSYPLFELVIGDDDADSVGELTDADGVTRSVSASLEQVTEDSSLTEGEQDRVYAMQEEINNVIGYLD